MTDEPNDKADAAGGTDDNNTADGADDQDRVDRDKIDFDPDDGLYSGTAVDGTSDIPGPHEDQADTDT